MKDYTYRLQHPEGWFYIGSRHSTKENPYEDLGIRYKSHGGRVHELGFDNFYFGVLQEYPTYEEAFWAEQQLIKDNWHLRPTLLNGQYLDWKTGQKIFSMYGRKHTAETKLKISKAHRGKKRTKKHRMNISKANSGRLQSEETKQKRSLALKGRIRPPRTKEWCLKLSIAHKGKTRPKRGPRSAEDIQKIKEGMRRALAAKSR